MLEKRRLKKAQRQMAAVVYNREKKEKESEKIEKLKKLQKEEDMK